MKRNCLIRPGQGPASRALTLKVGSYLCSASEGSNALAEHRTPAASHQSLCLPVFKARRRESDFQEQKPSSAGSARLAPAPSRLGVYMSCSGPAVAPSHSHCAHGGRAVLPETNSLGQLLHRWPSAPGKLQSSISSCSLNTE